jgi:hypothetical protein
MSYRGYAWRVLSDIVELCALVGFLIVTVGWLSHWLGG